MRLDFLVPGFSLCGSTTLCSMLGAHPDIYLPQGEDFRCFDLDDYEVRLPAFEARFEGHRGESALGDGSARYTEFRNEERTRRRILDRYPDLRLIFIARDPVDRIESAFRELHDGEVGYGMAPSLDLARAFEDDPGILEEARYHSRLENWASVVAPERIHVVLLEELVANPGDVLAACFRFLGVDDGFRPPLPHWNGGETTRHATERWREVAKDPQVRSLLARISQRAREELLVAMELREPFEEGEPEWTDRAVEALRERVMADATTFLRGCGRTPRLWPRLAALADGRGVQAPTAQESTSGETAQRRSSFPEHWFRPALEHWADYEESCRRGRERMLDRRAVFAGIGRNIASALGSVRARIEQAGAMFADYRVYLYESDSEDETEALLDRWSAENRRVAFTSERLGAPAWKRDQDPRRMRHLAACRNRYLERVAADYGDFDYLIVFDPDLHRGFSYEGLAHSFGQEGWDVLAGNSLLVPPRGRPWDPPMYFDAWAFRFPDQNVAPPLEEINQLSFRRGTPLVPVASAFGGLAVYRMEAATSGARYGGDDCEHVVFHRDLASRGFGSIYLNPSQIVLYSGDR